MGAVTSTISDDGIFAEARRAFPNAKQLAIESLTVNGNPAANEIRLLVRMSRREGLKVIARASDRSKLWLMLISKRTPKVKEKQS